VKTILTLTLNPAVDLSSSVASVFPDHKLRCGPMRSDPGGGGVNVSRAIRRLGGESIAMFCSGGPNGIVLGELLDAEGVVHCGIHTRGWTRQSVTILESSTGQQYRFVMPGPELSESEWRETLNAIRTTQPFPDLVVASGSLPPGVPGDFYAQLARVVREGGGRLMLDTSGPSLALALREGIFIAKPSLRELRAMAKGPVELEADQASAAMEVIRSNRCEALVVSLGAAGVLFATESGCERLHAPSVVVQSRVGAGDSMVGGIAFALAEGWALRDAVRFGIATGTAAVMNPGTELCHRKDVDRLFGQMNDAR
jgi:6-phosphofructokinase 2